MYNTFTRLFMSVVTERKNLHWPKWTWAWTWTY